MSVTHPFHLAIAVRDITEARWFYGTQLALPEGRSTQHWIDFNLFGHQLVTHLDTSLSTTGKVAYITNQVDADSVPIPHFGVVLTLPAWDALRNRVEGFVEEFVIAPTIRFVGEAGEQRTMFFQDPSGNALEFKAFANVDAELFRRE